MIELTRPTAFVPLHGTRHHLERHAQLARELGVSSVRVIENGQTLSFTREHGLETSGPVTAGKVAIAQGGEPLPPGVLRRRAELGRNGLCTITLVLDDRDNVVAPPAVLAEGVPGLGDEVALRLLARAVALALEDRRGASIEDEARRALRRQLAETTRTRPLIQVQLVRVGG